MLDKMFCTLICKINDAHSFFFFKINLHMYLHFITENEVSILKSYYNVTFKHTENNFFFCNVSVVLLNIILLGYDIIN